MQKVTGIFALVCVLSGCLGETENNLLGLIQSDKPEATPATQKASDVPTQLAVAEGVVVVAGPEGYCVDTSVSKDRRNSSFVLLASCASVTGTSDAFVPQTNALLTATVGGAGTAGVFGEASAMQAYVGSPAGRAALSRNGKADGVVIEDSFMTGNTFIVQTRDTSGSGSEELGERSWRAFFDQGDRTVAATVISLAATPITADSGLALLDRFVSEVREKSGGSAAVGQAAIALEPVLTDQ